MFVGTSPEFKDAVVADGGTVGVLIADGHRGVWAAWHRLNEDRNWISGGMGPPIPQRITWRAVRDWCAFHGVPDWTAFYDGCFAAMDEVWMAWRKARLPK